MRKRLIEKFTKSKEGSMGYTLTELMVVVGIIAIVCAIAIPSIIALSRTLRFKQANDYAKSIFMAAQQNLTELRSDGGLGALQKANGKMPITDTGFPAEFKAEYVYSTNEGITPSKAFSMVLPTGSIDATVLADNIIIEYNPITGNVYAVFYCQDPIASEYQASGLPRDDEAKRKDMMLGYYDGSGLNSSQIDLEKTKAEVDFLNGEEGIVQVSVPIPEAYRSRMDVFAKALGIKLTVTGEQSQGSFSVIMKQENMDATWRVSIDGLSLVYELPIDSLRHNLSFANYAANTQAVMNPLNNSLFDDTNAKSLTTVISESTADGASNFTILPGENVTLIAEVECTMDGLQVDVEPGIKPSVNPMFGSLMIRTVKDATGKDVERFTLTLENGRHLQNLNAIAPSVAKSVEIVAFGGDIYWDQTVDYYNDKYGTVPATDAETEGEAEAAGITRTAQRFYTSPAVESPARALPYFVPIHNENLFGTARFVYPGENDGGLGAILNNAVDNIFGGYSNKRVPTLTDEIDAVEDTNGVQKATTYASIQGQGSKVYNINIDATKYATPSTGGFYATGPNQVIDHYFTGLFGYVNTDIDNLHVVNPIVKGHNFESVERMVPGYGSLLDIFREWWTGTKSQVKVTIPNNPATGALLGAGGYNTLVTNCSTYIDKYADGFELARLTQGDYPTTAEEANAYIQNWYGVSGEGAVGGLVGYTKSHHDVKGELTDDLDSLAFSKCFAAVPVSGNMRGNSEKHYGYSNGVGGMIGNSQLSNFYHCYASGNVRARGSVVYKTTLGEIAGIGELFGVQLDLLYDGRTSMGTGGFVGSSHGTRYTRCFATGNVTSHTGGLGSGGFVGVMSIDETHKYGNDIDENGNLKEVEIAQRTVFTQCYSVGMVSSADVYENFSGTNSRIRFEEDQSNSYIVGDFYKMYVPYYYENRTYPPYESVYLYRDSYYLSNYHVSSDNQENSSKCADPALYNILCDLIGSHAAGSTHINNRISTIKATPLYYELFGIYVPSPTRSYQNTYFRYNRNIEPNCRTMLSEAYTSGGWGKATAETTHPYNVNASGSVYPFTMLEGLDYYGDWPARPSSVGMAYYEKYEDVDQTHYLFDKPHPGEDVRLNLLDGEDVTVVEDGYVILGSNSSMTVTVAGTKDTLTSTGDSITINKKPYYIFTLTKELRTAADKAADKKFYVPVTVIQDGTKYTMYYNPNVTSSQVNPGFTNNLVEEPTAVPTAFAIRSARQFKELASTSYLWDAKYTFVQELHIDADKYSKTLYTDWTDDISAIGTGKTAFSATYTSRGGGRKQAEIRGFEVKDTGMFGVIGEKGKLENLKIICNDALTITGSNVGVAVGSSEGSLINVDLVLKKKATLTASDNAGLLAGLSSGSVTNCDLTAEKDVKITANSESGGAGTLLGNAAGDANKKSEVKANTVTVSGDLTITAPNAGGMLGKTSHVTAENLTVTLSGMDATADYTGGLVGNSDNSTYTGVTVNLGGSTITGSAAIGGVAGTASHTQFTQATVNSTGTIKGKDAGGLMGEGGESGSALNSTVNVFNVTGTEKAGGAAATLGINGMFENVRVNLTGKISGKDAAGFAAKALAGSYSRNGSNVVLSSGIIEGTTSAAGYICTINGNIMNSNVRGSGTITAPSAAGFAITLGERSGITLCGVSPALDNTKAAYDAAENAHLQINGGDNGTAAGFVLTISTEATVSNSHALGKILGGTRSGFVGTLNGRINGCQANVDIDGGNAFVGTNNGTIERCYGWYGDHDPEKLTSTDASVSGKCYSSYFVDLHPKKSGDAEPTSVTLYDADGKVHSITASALQGSQKLLAGSKYTWFSTEFDSYPYNGNIKPANYLYPMLRDHYGDWTTPPQYAFGVAYYELYDGSMKIHVVDMSDPGVTEEKKNISGYFTVTTDETQTWTSGTRDKVFSNDGVIKETGYAVFDKDTNDLMNSYYTGKDDSLGITYTVSIGDRTFKYDFHKLAVSGGEVELDTNVSDSIAKLYTGFADAIGINKNPEQPLWVRTPAQLGSVATQETASFKQTHDIQVEKFPVVKKLGGEYDGNGRSITVTGKDTATWIAEVTAKGSVKDLNLIPSQTITAPIFQNVQGSVALANDLSVTSIGKGGALANKVSGSLTVKNVTAGSIAEGASLVNDITGSVTAGNVTVNGNVDGMIFGSDSGSVKNVSAGTITVSGNAKQVFSKVSAAGEKDNGVVVTGITVTGTLSDSLYGSISGDGKVNTGNVEVNAAPKRVFAPVSGSLTAGNVHIKGDAAKVFENITGSVETGAITIDGKAPAVFSEIGSASTVGTVNVTGDITVTGKADSVFGSIKGDVDTKNIILNGGAGQVFGTVAGTGVTVNGNVAVTGAVDKVFGTVSAPVTVTGAITAGSVGTHVFDEVKAAVSAGHISISGNAPKIFGNISSDVTLTGDQNKNGIIVSGEAGTILGTVSGGTVDTKGISLGSITGMILTEATGGTVTFGDITIGKQTASAQASDAKQSRSGLDTSVEGIIPAANAGTDSQAATEETKPSTTGMQTLFGPVSGGAVVSGGSLNLNGKDVKDVLFTSASGAKTQISGFQLSAGALNKGLIGTVSSGAKVSGFGLTVGAVNADLIGAVSGGSEVSGFTLSAGTMNGSLVTSVAGSNTKFKDFTSITVGDVKKDLIGAVSDSASVSGITVTKAGTMEKKLITSITDASVSGITVTEAGALKDGLIGAVSKTSNGSCTLADITVKKAGDVTGHMIASISGGITVRNFSANVGTMNASLIGGQFAGSLNNVDLTASGMTLSAGSGILVDAIAKNQSAQSCDITIPKVTLSSGTKFGGLAGSNAGSMESNTIQGNANGGAMELSLPGGGTFGGLVGSSSGNLKSNKVKVTMTVSGTSLSTVGGLVGEMTGGSLSDDTVSGAINGSAGGSKVGGAVGSMTGGKAENVTTSATVASGWKTANANSGTFASNITDCGPVGAFVGYVGDVTLTGCKSEWKDNATYQFLGEAKMGTKDLNNNIVSTTTLYDSFTYDSTLQTYVSGDKQVTVAKVADDATCPRVLVNLSGCTFYLKDNGQREQTYGVSKYYYAEGERQNQSSYTKGADAVVGIFSATSLKFKDAISSNESKATNYYVKTSDGYHRMTITRTSEGEWYQAKIYTYSITLDGSDQIYEFKETRKWGQVSTNYRDADITSSFGKVYSSAGVLGIYTITQPTLSAEKYLLIASDGKAYKDDRSAAVVDQFDAHNLALCSVIWNASELQGTTLCGKNSYSNAEVTNGKILAVHTTGGQACSLYPLTENKEAYYIVNFSRVHTENDYLRQFVTHTAPAAAAASIEETNNPAGETGGEG